MTRAYPITSTESQETTRLAILARDLLPDPASGEPLSPSASGAIAELSEAVRPFVIKAAHAVYRRPVPGCDPEDLIQAALAGLPTIVARWTPGRCEFLTYAGRSFFSRMWLTYQETARTIRLPKNVAIDLRRNPADGSRDTSFVSHARAIRYTRPDDREWGTRAIDQVAAPVPEERPEFPASAEMLGQWVKRLPDRLARVIRWRYGLHGGGPKSLAQIGRRLGVSKERVRQLEEQALRFLKLCAIGKTPVVRGGTRRKRAGVAVGGGG